MAKRLIIGVLGLSASLLAFGFIAFSIVALRSAGTENVRADAIVVLTGGGARIAAAGKLLGEGRANRLLISGVNTSTRKRDLLRLSRLPPEKFDCCVDVGYKALNTAGNASETRSWVRDKNFISVIVVTSGYHMPRSLMELKREMPGITLIPYPVQPTSLSRERWWLDKTTMRVLVSEYLKLLPAAARFAASRIVGNLDKSTAATKSGQSRAESRADM